jgi:hypothetical protein
VILYIRCPIDLRTKARTQDTTIKPKRCARPQDFDVGTSFPMALNTTHNPKELADTLRTSSASAPRMSIDRVRLYRFWDMSHRAGDPSFGPPLTLTELGLISLQWNHTAKMPVV